MTHPVQPRLRGLGVSTHFERRTGGWKAEALIPRIVETGISVVRQEIEWHHIERIPGVYAIPATDRDWLDRARDAGLRVIMVLCYGNPVHADPLDPAAYARYAAWMATELATYPIAAFELWNEPTNFQVMRTHGGPWSGTPPCPWLERYAAMVAAAAGAIKAVSPAMRTIINPGEAQFVHMAQSHPAALAHVDGVSHHPYPSRFPPETIPWGGAQIRARDGVDAADDDHSFRSLWRMTRAHARRCLGREVAVYATEYGYSTYNHHRKPGIFAGHSETAQAAYLVRGTVLALGSGVEALCIYDFMDDGVDRFEAEHNFGLVRHEQRGWQAKPVCAALRRLAGVLGTNWSAVDAPAVSVDCPMLPLPSNADDWQAPVVEPHLRITGPQLQCFAVDGIQVAILWGGGRYPTEWNHPIGDLVWSDAPAQVLDAIDLVTGDPLPLVRSADGLRLSDLPFGGNPIAVRWR